MGDGTLVEFASVVDAVKCAVAIERALVAADGGSPSGNGIQLRIGINLGDVIVEGDDLYGDGVNVAARLETWRSQAAFAFRALPMTIPSTRQVSVLRASANCASRTLPTRCAPTGCYSTNGPTTASRRWPNAKSVLMAGIAYCRFRCGGNGRRHTSGERHRMFLIGRHSPYCPSPICPGVQTDEYFADGITEDLTTELAKLSGCRRHRPQFVVQVQGSAGRPARCGSRIRRALPCRRQCTANGDDIRINAALVDAQSGTSCGPTSMTARLQMSSPCRMTRSCHHFHARYQADGRRSRRPGPAADQQP